MRTLVLLASVVVIVVSGGPASAQQPKSRDVLVREDLANVSADGFWVYNDLPKAIAAAKRTNQPLLVVIRCIPCEACAQLDSDIVERDPAVRELMQKFVCVRIVQANGLDLSLFQYDYDQSFAALLMNADRTIYGRYGTRSHQTESDDDVSLEGFAEALKAALRLHEAYPGNKALLAGKQSSEKPAYAVPEQYPPLREKYGSKLDYEGKVVQSCIHCHQVGQAQRQVYRDAGKPIPDNVLFPYPHPKALGLIMDPKQAAKVKRVLPDSPAEQAGFKAGDDITSLAGQPLLSIADVQWVLHNAPERAKLSAQVRRDGQTIPLQLTLADGWRQRDDISWRASSWELRRMTLGGLVLEDAPESVRSSAALADDRLALRVRHVGQYGAHAHAKRVGFKNGDVIVSVAGSSKPMREADVLALLVNNQRVGDKVPFTVLRDGKRMELSLNIQE